MSASCSSVAPTRSGSSAGGRGCRPAFAPRFARTLPWAGALGLCAAGLLALHLGAPPWRVLTLLVIAPVAEEAVFRAGLQEALLRRRWTPALANGATALAFAAAHVLASGQASAALVLVPALGLGRVYQQGRRLRNCIAWHAGLNAAWIVGRWLLPGLLP